MQGLANPALASNPCPCKAASRTQQRALRLSNQVFAFGPNSQLASRGGTQQVRAKGHVLVGPSQPATAHRFHPAPMALPRRLRTHLHGLSKSDLPYTPPAPRRRLT